MAEPEIVEKPENPPGEGWRDMIDGGPARNKGIKPMPARVMPTKVINSVWALSK